MTELGDISIEVVPHAGQIGDLGPTSLVDKFASRADELGHALADIATRLRETLEDRLGQADEKTWGLSEVSLQLSLNLETEAGVLISRAKAGAAFDATLTWKRRDPTRAPEAER